MAAEEHPLLPKISTCSTATAENSGDRSTAIQVIEQDEAVDRSYHTMKAGTASTEPSLEPPKRRYSSDYLFQYIVITQIFIYLEAGAVPSLLDEFTILFQLDPQEQGLLGAIVYISLSIATPLCALCFRSFEAKWVLGWTLLINNLSLILFASIPVGFPSSIYLLVISRGFIGFTQAFLCVYSPLWVHEFAPANKRARWMSYLQGAIPIGITLGYLIGSIASWSSDVDNSSYFQALNSRGCMGCYCWRWPFIFQAFVVLPICLVVFLIPKSHLNIQQIVKRQRQSSMIMIETPTTTATMSWDDIDQMEIEQDKKNRLETILEQENETECSPNSLAVQEPQASSIPSQETPNTSTMDKNIKSKSLHRLKTTRSKVISSTGEEEMEVEEEEDLQMVLMDSSLTCGEGLFKVLKLPVFVCIVLGLSALYFVVAGVQYWVTLFLLTNTNNSVYAVHSAYLIVSGTGPIAGVFFGGWLIDSVGGYSTAKQEIKALKICCILGTIAVIAAIPTSYLSNIYGIGVGLWIMLFCGGAIVPSCSGIVIACAPSALRPIASSVAYTSYNLFGYAASNYIPGLIMQIFSELHWNPIGHHSNNPTSAISNTTSDEPTTDGCDTMSCRYRLGFRIVLFWSIWAWICIVSGYGIAKYQYQEKQKQKRLATQHSDSSLSLKK